MPCPRSGGVRPSGAFRPCCYHRPPHNVFRRDAVRVRVRMDVWIPRLREGCNPQNLIFLHIIFAALEKSFWFKYPFESLKVLKSQRKLRFFIFRFFLTCEGDDFSFCMSSGSEVRQGGNNKAPVRTSLGEVVLTALKYTAGRSQGSACAEGRQPGARPRGL